MTIAAAVTHQSTANVAADRDPRWAAVAARDRRADGTFYYSVSTTGVYCRPSCGARQANPRNVRFHQTAADAERQSFGCGAGSDFTYFAKAYFDEALRGTYSFEAAFDQARASIDARERAEGRTPSNPQIFVGDAIQAKLQRLDKRLHALKPVMQATAPPSQRPAPASACDECQ